MIIKMGMKAKKACSRMEYHKKWFCISNDTFTKWRKFKEQLKLANNGATFACHSPSHCWLFNFIILEHEISRGSIITHESPSSLSHSFQVALDEYTIFILRGTISMHHNTLFTMMKYLLALKWVQYQRTCPFNHNSNHT